MMRDYPFGIPALYRTPSHPRNKNIAEVFFKAGYIEAWGRGNSMILDAFRKAELPEPIIEEMAGGMQITFLKDIFSEEYLQRLGLNERQVKADISPLKGTVS